jgi:hypothetical protein
VGVPPARPAVDSLTVAFGYDYQGRRIEKRGSAYEPNDPNAVK